MAVTLAGPAKNPGIPSVLNASKFTKTVLKKSVAAVSQTMLDTQTLLETSVSHSHLISGKCR